MTTDKYKIKTADQLTNELHDTITNVEEILRIILALDVEKQVVYRINNLAKKLDQSDFETTAKQVGAYATRSRKILRKALLDVHMELDCMNYEISKGIKDEEREKANDPSNVPYGHMDYSVQNRS